MAWPAHRESRGSLSKTNTNRWRGQWFVYSQHKDGKLGKKRKVAYFGYADVVTQDEAMAAFRKVIERSRKGAVLNSRAAAKTRTWFVPDALARGVAGEMAVCIDLLAKGWEVFRNINPTGKVDLLAMIKDGREAFRVQVKSAAIGTNGKPIVSLGEQASRMDMLAAVLEDGSVRYFDSKLNEILRPSEDQHENELQLEIVSD